MLGGDRTQGHVGALLCCLELAASGRQSRTPASGAPASPPGLAFLETLPLGVGVAWGCRTWGGVRSAHNWHWHAWLGQDQELAESRACYGGGSRQDGGGRNIRLFVKMPLGHLLPPLRTGQGGNRESWEANVGVTRAPTPQANLLDLTSPKLMAPAELLTQTMGWVAPPGVVRYRDGTL